MPVYDINTYTLNYSLKHVHKVYDLTNLLVDYQVKSYNLKYSMIGTILHSQIIHFDTIQNNFSDFIL